MKAVDYAIYTTSDMADSAVSGAQGILDTVLSTLGGAMEFIKPALVALIIILVGGWIIKKILKFVQVALEKVHVDAFFDKIGLTGQLKEFGVDIAPSAAVAGVIGVVAKVALYMAAINVLGIEALSALMQDILTFLISDGIVAIILLVAGLAIANFVKDLITNSASLFASADTAKTVAKAAKIAVLAFTTMAVLNQLNIAADLIQTLFSGIVGIVTLAGGIAFGLGGQE
ncbi:TPA: hypothetical protein EYP45_00315, partial [Candidatus Peregrinibacteria bacterium]|nr:hypothetical protein [Candidatus Peregrinibacteria bacterium]